MSVRENCAEGRFYSDKRSVIEDLLSKEVDDQKDDIRYSLAEKAIIGGVVPHAGHIFCAHQAVHFFEIVRASQQSFDTVVILSPNHTGMGVSPMSVDGHSQWKTPLGTVDVDLEMASDLGIPVNNQAQRFEHSAEVVVPYLQYFMKAPFRIVAVNILDQNLHHAARLAALLRDSAEKLQRRVLLIASSDFTHFKNSKVGYELDSMALEPLLKFNLGEFEHRVRTMQISICGFGPIMVLMTYARLIDAKSNVEVLLRGHSGEVYPSSEVVDYISMIAYH